MLRWLKRITVALTLLAALALILGTTTEHLLRARTATRFPHPGRLVQLESRRLHLDCRGSGAPTVVLEAGLDTYGSLTWAAVHDSLAATTRACAYSRAGLLWSDPQPGAFDSRQTARDLHMALAAADERAPFVLVGHSLGGPYNLTFTGLYPEAVAGLVFVDTSHPEQLARFKDAVGIDMEPPLAPLRAMAALSWTGLGRLLPSDAPRLMPKTAADVGRAYYPTSIPAMVRELAALRATLDTAGHYRQLGDRPAIFLTADAPTSTAELEAMKMTPAQGETMRTVWRELQADQARWSTRGRQELVPDATHYIQFDRPDVVIRAVREVVQAVRSPRE